MHSLKSYDTFFVEFVVSFKLCVWTPSSLLLCVCFKTFYNGCRLIKLCKPLFMLSPPFSKSSILFLYILTEMQVEKSLKGCLLKRLSRLLRLNSGLYTICCTPRQRQSILLGALLDELLDYLSSLLYWCYLSPSGSGRVTSSPRLMLS